MLTDSEREKMYTFLVEMAASALEKSYSPYSNFKVGAAALCSIENDIIVTDGPSRDYVAFGGTNVENASYGLTICAERVAMFSAIANGYRNIDALAVVCEGDFKSMPCGACRQVMWELNPHMDIVVGNKHGEILEIISLENLFPRPFEKGE